MSIKINDHDQIDHLVEIITSQANSYPYPLGGAKGYLYKWLKESHINMHLANTRVQGLSGDAESDARENVLWAINQGNNLNQPGYTTLGSLLEPLLPDLGIEDSRYVLAALIGEIVEEQARNTLLSEYGIPLNASPLPDEGISGHGPDFEWYGPDEKVQLQSFLKPPPNILDIGVLQTVVERSTGVCRIEFPNSKNRATGFLIGSDLLLTNYHVFGKTDEDLMTNAPKALLKFGKVSVLGVQGVSETEGTTFHLDEQAPVVRFSQSKDYALLRVQNSIQSAQYIIRVPITNIIPQNGDELHILGHPAGEAMKIAMSSEGVVYVSTDKGIAQYTTPSQAGASGSPCFSDEWKAIILHQSERSKGFGVVRQGILMSSILAEIQSDLNKSS